ALDDIRRRYGVVFQGGALFDSMSCADNVAFPLRERLRLPRPEISKRVEAALVAVGLEGMGAKNPAEVSGGMRKRVAIARTRVNVAVGVFVLIGIVALGYLSIKLGRVSIFGGGAYEITADFPSVGGLKAGSAVEIAGVEIGRVEAISLVEYQARVTLRINSSVKLQEDSIASIKTKGLIGEKYMRISPGGSEKIIQQTGRIREVEA